MSFSIGYFFGVVGVRALDGRMTDLLERDAFAAKHSINDIYSCSWGPDDDGRTVDGPHTLAKVCKLSICTVQSPACSSVCVL